MATEQSDTTTTIKTAIEYAVQDPEFAKQLLLNPVRFAAEYHLSEQDIQHLQELSNRPLSELLKVQPKAAYSKMM